jgi:GT2 family glycosyltransferase
MSISVVVSNFNGLNFLPRLLDSLRGQLNVTTEIIIVDRQSKDGSREYLKQFPEIKVLIEPAISGLVAGYAAGAVLASYDHLFFCNEDMWFGPDCLRLLLERISLPERIAAADPWQWTYDGAQWIHGGTRFFRCNLEINSPYPRRAFNFTVPLAAGERVPFPCAGAFLIHRDAYNDIGGWDTSFFLDHEEIDLFVRAWQKNWHCVTVPEAKVYHAVNAANSKKVEDGRTVQPMRYVAGRSNLAVIGLKYYSGTSLALPCLSLMVPLILDVLKLRRRKILLDLKAIVLTLKRMGLVRNFRRKNHAWAKLRPGNRFFLQKDMTIS